MAKNNKDTAAKIVAAEPCPLSSYVFCDGSLKRQALTHSSNEGSSNNETLEFLGDAVLQHVVTSWLYGKFAKHYSEGALTRWRTQLVMNTTLATIYEKEQLLLKTGSSMRSDNTSTTMLAGAVEALIGAIYLDAGIETCQSLIIATYERHSLLPDEPPPKSAKNMLQEWLQKKSEALPKYRLVGNGGKDGKDLFTVQCRTTFGTAQASGSNKRSAEQAAAKRLLQRLQLKERLNNDD
ncbi:MAG: ribonuclease III [Candidatus Porifericomitaceae bacterium WSBS_2022_MAG_OTU9]